MVGMIDLTGYRLVLGSGSPRRKQLLEAMGFDFEVIPSRCQESLDSSLSFGALAASLAVQKARAFRESFFEEKTLLVTADTIVCTEDEVLGKPSGREEALQMLQRLSGKSHRVITGVCIKSRDGERCFHHSTWVTFATLHPREIAYYLDTYKPYDKAGAYGIQEWIGLVGITHIEGSYFNVMGLPTHRLYEELKSFIERV